MTLREYLHQDLVAKGLFPEEADSVIATFADQQEAMKDRWSDHTEGYPAPLLASLIVGANITAGKWLEQNKPLHWARGMFS